jgi:hypothetical protein
VVLTRILSPFSSYNLIALSYLIHNSYIAIMSFSVNPRVIGNILTYGQIPFLFKSKLKISERENKNSLALNQSLNGMFVYFLKQIPILFRHSHSLFSTLLSHQRIANVTNNYFLSLIFLHVTKVKFVIDSPSYLKLTDVTLLNATRNNPLYNLPIPVFLYQGKIR